MYRAHVHEVVLSLLQRCRPHIGPWRLGVYVRIWVNPPPVSDIGRARAPAGEAGQPVLGSSRQVRTLDSVRMLPHDASVIAPRAPRVPSFFYRTRATAPKALYCNATCYGTLYAAPARARALHIPAIPAPSVAAVRMPHGRTPRVRATVPGCWSCTVPRGALAGTHLVEVSRAGGLRRARCTACLGQPAARGGKCAVVPYRHPHRSAGRRDSRRVGESATPRPALSKTIPRPRTRPRALGPFDATSSPGASCDGIRSPPSAGSSRQTVEGRFRSRSVCTEHRDTPVVGACPAPSSSAERARRPRERTECRTSPSIHTADHTRRGTEGQRAACAERHCGTSPLARCRLGVGTYLGWHGHPRLVFPRSVRSAAPPSG
ncbi:hypothetical protein C8Q77DRAFT_732094 [Trametes polyzona]|nr:hypothetical protein C8Q77DRAFT_732094 [Trametes polyzona]